MCACLNAAALPDAQKLMGLILGEVLSTARDSWKKQYIAF